MPFIVRATPGAGGTGLDAALPATLWVDAATGDDSRSKATVAASGGSLPWATIGRAAWGSTNRAAPNAAEAADAGDVVAVAAGTYNYAGTVSGYPAPRFEVLYNPVNDGTALAPIRFQASGTVTLTAASLGGPIIGANGVDYIEWMGFSADETAVLYTPDTGLAVFTGTTGSKLLQCTLAGVQAAYNDNNPAVRIENATSVVVRGCTISGFRKTPDNHNGCGVQMYGALSCLIERNDISDCGGGVFFKDTNSTNTQQSNVVRYNHIDGCNDGVIWSELTAPSVEGRNDVYQNLITNGQIGLSFIGAVGDYAFNNTIVGMTSAAIFLSGTANKTGVRVWNTIAYDCFTMVYVDAATMPAASILSLEHNCYRTYTNFYTGTDGNRTFASFNAAYTDQHAATPAPITDDPLFENAASDFRLQTGSPARNLGVDALDLDQDGSTVDAVHAGCYLTQLETIGVT